VKSRRFGSRSACLPDGIVQLWEQRGAQTAAAQTPMEEKMAWTAPVIEEVTCGMEINMYFPAEEEAGDLH
jgi:coenzyme PQQ precursor peptide PqqA